MLTHIGVQNKLTVDIPFTLNLSNPSNGFVVKEITGLDPVKATLVSSTFANLDGETYHSGRRDARNIVIRLGLKHKTTSIEDLRKYLYQTFMPKSEIGMSFHIGATRYFNITGVVESCEAPLFVKEPEMVVSIMCFDPDFREPLPGAVSGVTTSGVDFLSFEYSGTVPVGATLALTANSGIPSFALAIAAQGRPEKFFRYDTALLAGDQLTVKMRRGERAATILRGGSTISAMYGIRNTSEWLELQPGPNTVRVYSSVAGQPYTLSWTARHGGL